MTASTRWLAGLPTTRFPGGTSPTERQTQNTGSNLESGYGDDSRRALQGDAFAIAGHAFGLAEFDRVLS